MTIVYTKSKTHESYNMRTHYAVSYGGRTFRILKEWNYHEDIAEINREEWDFEYSDDYEFFTYEMSQESRDELTEYINNLKARL